MYRPNFSQTTGFSSMAGHAQGYVQGGPAQGLIPMVGHAQGFLPMVGHAQGGPAQGGPAQGYPQGFLPMAGHAQGFLPMAGHAQGFLPMVGPAQGYAQGFPPMVGPAQGFLPMAGHAQGFPPMIEPMEEEKPIFENIQVPSSDSIHSRLVSLPLKIDFENQFTYSQKLHELISQPEFQDKIRRGYDSSNKKNDYLEILRFLPEFIAGKKNVFLVDYEHLGMHTYKRNLKIKPQNLRSYNSDENLPKFEIPIIYIVKKAIVESIEKIIIICKNPDNTKQLKKHISEFKTIGTVRSSDGVVLDYPEVRDFVQRNPIVIIEIHSLCNLLCQPTSLPGSSASPPGSKASPPGSLVSGLSASPPGSLVSGLSASPPGSSASPPGSLVSGLSASPPGSSASPPGSLVLGSSASPPGSKARIDELHNIVYYCPESSIHDLKGCDDAIIVILCDLIKKSDKGINITLISIDRDLFSDFIASQSKIIPFQFTVHAKTQSETKFVNLARDPYDISFLASSIFRFLITNPIDIQRTYFKEFEHNPSNWFVSSDEGSWSNSNEKNLNVNKIIGTEAVPKPGVKNLPYTKLVYDCVPQLYKNRFPLIDRQNKILKINGTNEDYIELGTDGNWKTKLNEYGEPFMNLDGNIATITYHGQVMPYTTIRNIFYESPLNFNGQPFRDHNGNVLILSNGFEYVTFNGMNWESTLDISGHPFIDPTGNILTIDIPHSQILFNKYLKYKQKYLLLKQKLK